MSSTTSEVVPTVDASAAARAEQLKMEANALYAHKHYHEAIEKYTQAIQANPSVAAFYTNRAQCHLFTEAYGAAKEDAEKAISLDAKFTKGYFRKAAACMAMGDLKEARANFRQVAVMAPGDAVARRKYSECDKLYRRILFESAIDSEADRKRVAESIDLSKYPVAEDYDGPRMPVRKVMVGGEPQMVEVDEEYVDLEFVKGVAEWFREQKSLPLRYMYVILVQAESLLRKLPTLVDVAVPSDAIMTVCGDVHGQYYDVIMLFFALKLLYPDAFFLNRGNHESIGMNQLYGFEGEVRHKYPTQGKRLFDLFQETFEALPIAHLIQGKIFVVHGGLYSRETAKNSGLPDGDGVVRLDELRELPRFHQPQHTKLLNESLWSDPQDQEGRAPSPRGTAIQYGPDVTKEFCATNGLTMVIRSHQQMDEGYEIAHDGQMVTVFSAPNYCDSGTNKGAYIRITPELECTYHKFSAAMAYANARTLMY
ncbi:Serine/threonine-protein phosphatase 5 [Kickxella alabastrina]|uniref:Serine/threonine-protein phosphatase 5 n=1 Tax=Kickxella alabastrina TaxID=61397 RepID=UPI00221FC74E|nr:Serine/threonine-protein phosphatase 5 [Kickxella alabastrina]KAI7830097.1 Serine/threonine-protein phosphatase 5 [Kickxella alabastrina]